MATKFSKICETIWMTCAFIVLGINYSMAGPTLLDLKLILKKELDTLSTIPLSNGIGETSGMFFTLLVSRLGHKRLQMAVALLLSAVVIAIIPITSSYIYVDIMFFLAGFISAIPSCFLMDVCSELWKDKGTTLQFILVGSSIGAIATPLIVEPFLCHGESPDFSNYSSTEPQGFKSQGTENTTSLTDVFGSPMNATFICSEEDTNVRSAYLILGAVLLPPSLAFFYFWVRRNSKWAKSSITDSQRQDYAQFDVRMSKRKVVIFYIILFLSYMPVTALTIVFATYLTAFGVEGQLQLPKSTMVFMTSVFWLSTLIGRSISTLITSFIGHTKVIIGNFFGLIIAAVLLVFVAPYNADVLWLSTVLLGLFVCPFEGAGIAWAADYVGMSSNLVLLSWISASFGNLVFPFVGGQMFYGISPVAFLYLLAGLILFMILMFVVLVLMTRSEKTMN